MPIEDFADKGARNYARKLPAMASSYAASESRAKAAYRAAGFGPTRTSNYEASWATNPANYAAIVRPGLESKWRERWLAKMRE